MHGREARFPLEAEKSSAANLKMENVQERIDHLSKLKEDIFPIAKKNIHHSQDKQKKQYQKRKGILESSIRSGNLVLRLNMKKRTKKGHKMEDTWFGPYKVLRMSDTGSCSLYNMKTGTEVKQKVNASQLKLYIESAKKNDKETEAKTKDETHLAGDQNQVKPDDIDPVKMNQILEDQLFDDSILRLWRTGAEFNQWKSMEDDHSNVRQFI